MLPCFELYCPTNIREACKLKEQGALVLAGGTDIFVAMHGGQLRPVLCRYKRHSRNAGCNF